MIHICLTIDQNYFDLAKLCINTICSTKQKDTEVAFYILCNQVKHPEKFKIFERYNNVYVEAENYQDILNQRLPVDVNYFAHVTRTCWMRYFIPNHRWFTNLERVLYLDADAFAQKDLTPLYEIELNGKALGVVKDFGKFRHHLKAGGTAATFKHFNSGVLVMDLPKLRKLEFQEHCIMKTVISSSAHEFSSDQEVMNSFMQPHVQYLDPKFNLAPHFIWHSHDWFKSDMFSNITEWNKVYNCNYKSTYELIFNSYIWHFNGDKIANQGSGRIRTYFEQAELKLSEFEFYALGKDIGEYLDVWKRVHPH